MGQVLFIDAHLAFMEEKEMMNFEEFKENVRELLVKEFSEDTKIEMKKIVKNNNVSYMGLIVKTVDNNIAPVIYLEAFYEDYEHGKALDSIVKEISEVYQANKVDRKQDMQWFREWNCVKKGIGLKLINYENNRQLLEDVPHRQFLDLAIVYEYVIKEENKPVGTILIHNHHMEFWRIAEDILYTCACENYQTLMPVTIRSMLEVLGDMAGLLGLEELSHDETEMYVISNEMLVHGAGNMLFLKQYEDKAEILKRDLYIFPSSLHEIIVLPAEKGEASELAWIVKDVNRTQVDKEEQLSDNVYYYNHVDGTVRIA